MGTFSLTTRRGADGNRQRRAHGRRLKLTLSKVSFVYYLFCAFQLIGIVLCCGFLT